MPTPDPDLVDAQETLRLVFLALISGCSDSAERLETFDGLMSEIVDLADCSDAAPPPAGVQPIRRTLVPVPLDANGNAVPIPNGSTIQIPIATTGNSTVLLVAWSIQGGQVDTPEGFLPLIAHPDRLRLILFSRYFADPTASMVVHTKDGSAQDWHAFEAIEYAGHLVVIDANATPQQNDTPAFAGEVNAMSGGLVIGVLGCNSDEPWLTPAEGWEAPWTEIVEGCTARGLLVEDHPNYKSLLAVATRTGAGMLNPKWEHDPNGPQDVGDPGERQTCIGVAAAFSVAP